MMSDLAFEESFCSYYKGRGDTPDEDQLAVCHAVADIHSHFTELQLFEQVRLVRPEISEKTLSGTLGDMIHAGLIRKVYFGTEHIFYEHVHGHLHHDHLWCVECQKVIEFHDDRIEALQEQIAGEHGFLTLRHNLQLVGLCEDCKDKASKYHMEYHDHHHKDQAMPLAMVADGNSVNVVMMTGGRRMRKRLSDMGVLPGEKVRVISNRFAGPFIIEVKGTRLGIAHKLAHHILVEPVD